ncbi:hypothetical protein CFAM422_006696 [Trichoderma lentiforme]|uniref:Uncharacterized protein n=1 Tax=Trichoderma lentiforme TaxID=1567552 RepID=A0A9P5CED1_9HYPO|nr:hypothetical protein CFAM422_006696 [Trichoderma lentiforme]
MTRNQDSHQIRVLKAALGEELFGIWRTTSGAKYVAIPLSLYGMSPVGWMHWLFCSRQCLDLEDDLGVDLMKSGDNLLVANSPRLEESIRRR